VCVYECVCEREREREKDRVCVCVCERERECVRERERESHSKRLSSTTSAHTLTGFFLHKNFFSKYLQHALRRKESDECERFFSLSLCMFVCVWI